jgi:para-nitrobenzyl esterase
MTIALAGAMPATAAPRVRDTPDVRTQQGRLAGTAIADDPAVEAFLGVPYAAPPLGPLRWRAPRPAAAWRGTRQATAFGARCMQQALFADMRFRSPAMAEDCLTLNIWRPAGAKRGARLPVLFYLHGGGAVAGGGSEPRYDGAAMARRGIVVVTINYRLGVFGFFATPALAAESGDGSAGNYGLLDQAAALDWVRRHIAAFGGDPARITIGGESAGSMSVSVLMTSPLTRHLFARAIGESGGVMPPSFHPKPLAEAEREGDGFAAAAGAATLAELRALPAERLLAVQAERRMRADFIVDGRFLTETPLASYAAGRAAQVPLLLGTNTQEAGWQAILKARAPTLANYRAALAEQYGDRAAALAALYPAASDADVPAAATDLASDAFLAASTWSWYDRHRRLGAPTWLYHYARVRPATLPPLPPGGPASGAVHSAEIEYALGNLDVNPVYAWTDDDRRVSATMQGYVANFVRTGDPNGAGLPRWLPAPAGDGPASRQRIDVDTRSVPFVEAPRYAAAVPLLDAAAGR